MKREQEGWEKGVHVAGVRDHSGTLSQGTGWEGTNPGTLRAQQRVRSLLRVTGAHRDPEREVWRGWDETGMEPGRKLLLESGGDQR